MDTPILVKDDVEAGRWVVETLDAGGFPVTAAFWYLEPDWVEWRFAIASPLVDQGDVFAVYTLLRERLAGRATPTGAAHLGVILQSVHDPRVVEMRAFAGTDPAPYIGWHYRRRAYLYRAARLLPDAGVVPVRFAVRDKPAKRWVMSPGTLTFADGRLTAVTSEPGAARTRARRNGLSARFHTIEDVVTKKKQRLGHLRRWQFSDGRLEVLREEVVPVPVADATPQPHP